MATSCSLLAIVVVLVCAALCFGFVFVSGGFVCAFCLFWFGIFCFYLFFKISFHV